MIYGVLVVDNDNMLCKKEKTKSFHQIITRKVFVLFAINFEISVIQKTQLSLPFIHQTDYLCRPKKRWTLKPP